MIIAVGAALNIGILPLWKGIANASLANAVGGGLLVFWGSVIWLFGVALISYNVQLCITDKSISFSRTYFWLKRMTLLPRSALRWVACGHTSDVSHGRGVRGDLRVYLHLEGWPGDVAVHSIELEPGFPGIVNYDEALAQVMQKASEIGQALGIEHRPNWWTGREARHRAKVWGIARPLS